jgi:hypothetical protein
MFRWKPTDDRHHTTAIYESTNIRDAALLRHLGIMTINGAPVFDGFYALRSGGS